MKKKLLLMCYLLVTSFTSFAEQPTMQTDQQSIDEYQPPIELSSTEHRKTHNDLAKNHANLKKYWQNRIAIAKENDKKLAESGAGLARPYYGDHKASH